jgi:outer membrane lipoprotein-sorting protein
MGVNLMDDREKKLTNYIDSLNQERQPKEHQLETAEMEELFQTVRMVRSLREPSMPETGYADKLANNINKQFFNENEVKKTAKKSIPKWLLGVVAAAAALIIVVNTILPLGETNIVYAMEQAFKEVKAYHGVLEVVVINEEGKTTTQSKVEVWRDKDGRYFVKGLAGAQKGLITANDGEKKWQLQPEQKEVDIFPAFPDPYSFTFEIGNEIEDAKHATSTKVVGEETVAGRPTVVMEVTPQGGSSYKVWIDKDTKMPLQKQTAMEFGLQYLARYENIDFTEAVPKELFAYNLPSGFKEINTNPEQFVIGLDEAEKIVGFIPLVPQKVLTTFIQDNIAVVNSTNAVRINYSTPDKQKKVMLLQKKATEQFKPATMAVLGKVNGNVAEVQSPIEAEAGVLQGGGAYAGVTDISSVRWQQDGYEYAVVGNTSLEELALFIKGISDGVVQLISKDQPLGKPQVDVPVDLEVEKGDQKNIDAGHAPWKLDPAFVAQVFVSLKVSPEGIQGEYPIKYEELKVVQNTGTEAAVEVIANDTPISKVYLKRLIRQDNTGVWTVVGYDPNQ